MHYRKIIAELPASSVIAFGCASIIGRLSKKLSLRAIREAFEMGITHFDVARSYGYGEAEQCVGEALHNQRDKVIIATKFGIAPAQSPNLLTKLKPLARKTIQYFPVFRPLAKKGVAFAGAHAISGQFMLKAAKSSIETSLRELKTDYIDLLLMHSCTLLDISDEIFYFLESLKKEGKIRAHGVSTDIDVITKMQPQQRNSMFLQFPNDIFTQNHKKLGENAVFSTFSSFANVNMIKQIIATTEASIHLCKLQQKDIYELLLSYALSVNKSGAVVCSMLNKNHLKNNIDIVENPRFTQAQIQQWADHICKQNQPNPAFS